MEICVRVHFSVPRGKLTFYDTDVSFSVTEIHSFLVTLVRQFEFALPDNAPKVRTFNRTGLVNPVVEGEEHKGFRLPLQVTPIKNK